MTRNIDPARKSASDDTIDSPRKDPLPHEDRHRWSHRTVPAVIDSPSRDVLLAPRTAELSGPDVDAWLRES